MAPILYVSGLLKIEKQNISTPFLKAQKGNGIPIQVVLIKTIPTTFKTIGCC
jgi:hypothetical protein